MPKGLNEVVVSAQRIGFREECVVSGTPKPGTHMEIVPSTADQQGRFTYRARGTTFSNDGSRGPLIILNVDSEQGKTRDDAYVTLTRGFLHWPLPGEEFNLLARDQPGTGTLGIENIGDRLEVDSATGMLQPYGTEGSTGQHTSGPYILRERRGVDVTTNVHIYVQCTGLQM